MYQKTTSGEIERLALNIPRVNLSWISVTLNIASRYCLSSYWDSMMHLSAWQLLGWSDSCVHHSIDYQAIFPVGASYYVFIFSVGIRWPDYGAGFCYPCQFYYGIQLFFRWFISRIHVSTSDLVFSYVEKPNESHTEASSQNIATRGWGSIRNTERATGKYSPYWMKIDNDWPISKLLIHWSTDKKGNIFIWPLPYILPCHF